MLAFLHGDDAVDPDLAHIISAHDPCSIEDLAVAETAIAEARAALRTARHSIVLVSGTPGGGRRTLLASVAAEAGLGMLPIDARDLSREPALLTRQLRAIAREHRLLGRAPLIANMDAHADLAAQLTGELVPLVDGPLLLTCGARRPQLRSDRPLIHIEMPPPTSAQRARLWRRALGDASASVDDAERLAGQYPLAPAIIHHAAVAARARANDRALTLEDIYAGIRTVLDDKLGDHARRVGVTQSWDDSVLPSDQLDSIVELMARVRERRRVYEQWGFGAKVGKGLGTAALFSGPPGTGKTMVAALIARDLGLLSSTRSTWRA